MPEYVHGGDVYSHAERYGGEALDLSANISPFGIPPAVKRAMRDAVEDCTRYPDPFWPRGAARDRRGGGRGPGLALLRQRRGRTCSTGWRPCCGPKPRCSPRPTFAEYERTLGGADIRFHLLREDEGFAVTERILSDITPEIDAVYLCNPNNPTGRTIDPPLLHRIAENARKPARGSSWTSASTTF